VVTEMNDIICVSIDAESEAGSKIAKKYGVRGYPTLLFLSSDGSPRDSIGGYMPTDPFRAEVARIKSGEGTISAIRDRIKAGKDTLSARFDLIDKLKGFNDKDGILQQQDTIAKSVANGQGFEAANIDSRWKLSQRLRTAGLADLADEQIEAIRQLDPEGKSEAMRNVAFAEIRSTIKGADDLGQLEEFLASETHEGILFEGWNIIYSVHQQASQKTENPEEAAAARSRARSAAVELWKHAPEQYQAGLGNMIAWSYYEAADELSKDDRAFALSVAETAAKASSEDVNVLDTYACCLFMNGKVKQAIAQAERCIELDPDNEEWTRRRDEFAQAQG